MFQSKFIEKKVISDTVFEFVFTRPVDFIYSSGQFISILINNKTRRSYSLSSSPTESNLISTIVDISPGGPGTTFLKNLNPNNTLTFDGPYGHMVVPEDFNDDRQINFVCSGTGISPFVSIIKFLNQVKYKGEINILYSEKFEKDFYDLSKLTISNTYLSVTRENSLSTLTGRVTEHLELLPISAKSLFFVCGNTRMLIEVVKYLKGKNLDSGNIIYESFYY